MDRKHLRDLVADGAQRIERRHRLLKDHRDAGPAHLAHFRNRRRAEITTLEQHPAIVDRHLVGQQPHDGVGHHRLAGTGFADHAEDLVGSDFQRHVPQRMRPVCVTRQADAQAIEREDSVVPAHRLLSLGFSASLRPWPTSDTASTVMRMATPGIAETYHCTRSTSRPRPIRLPQDATLGSDSRRKASALSSRIATAITTLAYTMTGGSALGRISPRISRVSRMPSVLPA